MQVSSIVWWAAFLLKNSILELYTRNLYQDKREGEYIIFVFINKNYSCMEFHNSITEFYNSTTKFYNSNTDFYNSATEFCNLATDFYIT